MRDGIELRLDKEIGANRFAVNAYRYGVFCGVLRGHLHNRSGVIRLYPYARLVPGIFRAEDFPIALRFDEIPRERRAQGASRV